MATYNAPGVYVEDIATGNQSTNSEANSVGCLIGVTKNGELNSPTLVTSFNEYCEKFASGQKTPYRTDSYMTYAVSGFFANGGKQLYVDRVAHATAAKATGTISHINSGDNPSTEGWFTHDTDNNIYAPTTDTQVVSGTKYYEVEATSHTADGTENPSENGWYTLSDGAYTLSSATTCTEGDTFYTISATEQTPSGSQTVTDVTFTAKNEGEWGNDLKLTIAKDDDWTSESLIYKVTVETDGDSVVLSGLTISNWVDTILNNLKTSMWIGNITVASSYTALTETVVTFSGGVDGVTDIVDSDFTNALSNDLGKYVEDILFVAIPGQTSSTVNKALMDYCDEKHLFPILDMPKNTSVADTKTYRKSIVTANAGSLCYPWIVTNDPLTEGTITIPVCGHYMGIIARTIETRGMHKAPAGTDAIIRGAIALERELTDDEVGMLNPIGVICLCVKKNSGIVVWGARGLNSSDATLRYVTDEIINYTIRKVLFERTQFAVFEPNTDTLWTRLTGVCTDYLETLRLNGTLKGSAAQAYFVQCDSSNNTEATIAAGECYVDIGYAPVKPAEFVIIRLAHTMSK